MGRTNNKARNKKRRFEGDPGSQRQEGGQNQNAMGGKMEHTYFEQLPAHLHNRWLDQMPEAKKEMLQKHPLLIAYVSESQGRKGRKNLAEAVRNFYNQLDTGVMSMEIARALGPNLGELVIKGINSGSSPQNSESEKYAEYINQNSDVLPRNISVHLTHVQREEVVERLRKAKEIAQSDPPSQDNFLKANPGMIPSALSELLTQSERRDVIDALKVCKQEWMDKKEKKYKEENSHSMKDEFHITKSYLEALPPNKQNVWLDRVPEAKKEMLRKHPLLIPETSQKAKTHYEALRSFFYQLDPETMTMEVARGLGPYIGGMVMKKLKDQVTYDQSTPQQIENEKYAEYINQNSDVLPLNISVHLTHGERQEVVARLRMMKEIAQSDPPSLDTYLQENNGMIPSALSELLTQNERKEVIDALIECKKEWMEMRQKRAQEKEEWKKAKKNQGQTEPYTWTYLESLPRQVWVAMMPEQKQDIMGRSYYLTMTRNFGMMKEFYDSLDTSLMSLPVAKALGKSIAQKVLAKLGAGNAEERTSDYEMPSSIETLLEVKDCDTAKEYLKYMKEASSSPMDADDYLNEHADMLPPKIAELLTLSERKTVIDKLLHHKQQHAGSPFEIWVKRKDESTTRMSDSFTQLDYLLHKRQVWLWLMPESKRDFLEKHPLLAVPAVGAKENKSQRHKAMEFYSALDTELMSMKVAKAIGPIRGKAILEQLKNKEEPSPTQKTDNEQNAYYIHELKDILPESISMLLPHNERQDVVERLKLMNEISVSDPPGEDKYLQDNPGVIPNGLIDLLTQSERKEVIEKLIVRKKGGMMERKDIGDGSFSREAWKANIQNQEQAGDGRIKEGMKVKVSESSLQSAAFSGMEGTVQVLHGKTSLVKFEHNKKVIVVKNADLEPFN